MQNEFLEQAILDFISAEMSQGHFEFTVPEIEKGIGQSRLPVVRALDRLGMKEALTYRKKGTGGTYHLKQLADLWNDHLASIQDDC